jgi:hypothetical protein
MVKIFIKFSQCKKLSYLLLSTCHLSNCCPFYLHVTVLCGTGLLTVVMKRTHVMPPLRVCVAVLVLGMFTKLNLNCLQCGRHSRPVQTKIQIKFVDSPAVPNLIKHPFFEALKVANF